MPDSITQLQAVVADRYRIERELGAGGMATAIDEGAEHCPSPAWAHPALPRPRRGGYRMGMPETIRRWTREEVQALPDDGNRYELIDGELLVSPSPRGLHQRAVIALLELVGPFVRQTRIGSVGLALSDLDLRSGQLSQPDLFVVSRKPDGREPIDWADYGIPFLIAEVTSPSTARYDRITKRRRYQRSGVCRGRPDRRAVTAPGRPARGLVRNGPLAPTGGVGVPPDRSAGLFPAGLGGGRLGPDGEPHNDRHCARHSSG